MSNAVRAIAHEPTELHKPAMQLLLPSEHHGAIEVPEHKSCATSLLVQ